MPDFTPARHAARHACHVPCRRFTCRVPKSKHRATIHEHFSNKILDFVSKFVTCRWVTGTARVPRAVPRAGRHVRTLPIDNLTFLDTFMTLVWVFHIFTGLYHALDFGETPKNRSQNTTPLLYTVNIQKYGGKSILRPIFSRFVKVQSVVDPDENVQNSNQCHKCVQEGQITHGKRYHDLVKGPSRKSLTDPIFEGGKKKTFPTAAENPP